MAEAGSGRGVWRCAEDSGGKGRRTVFVARRVVEDHGGRRRRRCFVARRAAEAVCRRLQRRSAGGDGRYVAAHSGGYDGDGG